jgi:hypothetical protein
MLYEKFNGSISSALTFFNIELGNHFFDFSIFLYTFAQK